MPAIASTMAMEDDALRRKDRWPQRGYTLVELVVILSILLILASLAVPSFMSLRDRAKVNEAKQSMQHLRMAQALYAQSHPKFYYASNTDQLMNLTDITEILKAFKGNPTSLPIDVYNTDTGERYTITAVAKDSQNTVITATESKVEP